MHDGSITVTGVYGSLRPNNMMANALHMTRGVPSPKGGADVELMDAHPSASGNIKRQMDIAQMQRAKMFYNRNTAVQQAVDKRQGIGRLLEFVI